MDKPQEMVCNICKQVVKARKDYDNYMGLPVQHNNPATKDTCHGFFETGLIK